MEVNEVYCLRWDNFSSNIRSTFCRLKKEKDFADVTLVCGDGQTDSHKVILSAGSSFFQKILKNNPHSKPLIYMKGVKFSELQIALGFIYQGEATVATSDLDSFLAVAEDLELKGFSKEYMSNGSSDQFGQNSQHVPSSSLPQPQTNLQQPLTSSSPEESIKAEAQPIKAEDQSEQLEDFVEAHQAEHQSFQQYQGNQGQEQCSQNICSIFLLNYFNKLKTLQVLLHLWKLI